MKTLGIIFGAICLGIIGIGVLSSEVNKHNPIPDSRIAPTPTPTWNERARLAYIGETTRKNIPPPESTPDLSLLEITKHNWEKGGFDTVAIWHITFWNHSDKPIGNIRYRTSYNAETGDQVDRGGVDALLGDYTIRKVIRPHQKRTIEINDGFVNHEAMSGHFQVVSWEFVNPPD